MNDEYWAVPLYGMVQMLWYRKDFFAEAGYPESTQDWMNWFRMLSNWRRVTVWDRCASRA